VGRRDDDPIGQGLLPLSIVSQNGMGDHRGRSVSATLLNPHFHAVCSEDFKSSGQGRLRKSMGIDADKKRPCNSHRRPVFANGLADSKDMMLVKAVFQGGPAVPRRSEGDPLPGSSMSGRHA